MRGDDFRRIARGMQGAIEASHMGHPDFRAHGRIFATLNAEETRGVVMLTPEQQQMFLADHPAMFSPAAGAWGRSGSTMVHLDAADEDTVGEVVTLAWQNAALRLRPGQAVKAAAKSTPKVARAAKKRAVAKTRTPAGKKRTTTRKRSR